MIIIEFEVGGAFCPRRAAIPAFRSGLSPAGQNNRPPSGTL